MYVMQAPNGVRIGVITPDLYEDVSVANREAVTFKYTPELVTALTVLGENNLNALKERAAAGLKDGEITLNDLFVATARGYLLGLMHGKRAKRARRKEQSL